MGFGNGMAIGWPNATYQSGIPNLTAYIPASNSLNLQDDYTIEWFAITGGLSEASLPIRVFWSFGSDLTMHSAFLQNLGSWNLPDWVFNYYANGINIISVSVTSYIGAGGGWNFFVLQRANGKVYLGIDGDWVDSPYFGTMPVLSNNKPLYIGSNGVDYKLQNGEINNFRWTNRIAVYNPTSSFPVPSTNLILDDAEFLVCTKAFNLNELLYDTTGNGHNIINSTGTFFNDNPFGFNLQGSLRFA